MRHELPPSIFDGLEAELAKLAPRVSACPISKVRFVDVAALRFDLGLSQNEFAALIAVPVGTLRNWEQNRRSPSGPARVLLSMIERNPDLVVEVLR